VAERRFGQAEPAREATSKGSRGDAPQRAGFRALERSALAVLVVGVLAAALMVATELTPIARVDVASGSCEVINDTEPDLAARCSLSGFERHRGALILLAALTLALAYGTAVGRSRPAAAALLAVAVVVLGIALLRDRPVTRDAGLLQQLYEAKARPGPGFTLELIAGGLAAAAGLGGLARGEAS
jgi:hypothetical protein